ncbi:SPOR domain-containing protein [Legionella spiritensis]|uniref:Sporulation domain-containing protein n=1 Tax=Legionella spiritensis TaxID=452 RepID=A0A0W0YXH3_LEGSP|nr:SPOR domain-containing protein [Legionella spiritensis]KTD61544.1 Sporulation domain-containing protein [Legionella spiritensis]SNV32595.1 Sporulation domain-containing protein [Legionella spiritensis]VEG92282.1 Sporulation domain-containing protein [Legionella spiritensis]
MARDYGKNSNKRPPGKSSGPLLWVFVSFLLGYLAATLFDMQTVKDWVNHNVLAEKPQAQPRVKRVADRKPELPKPKFEFYTLLSRDSSAPTRRTPPPSQNQSPAPAAVPHASNPSASQPLSPAAPPTPPVTQSNPVTGTNDAYLVQIAAFNKRQDAERLKATLVLKGFDVSLMTVTQQNNSWYRVVVGPYHSRAEAEKAQLAVARTEHIKGIIRKLDA